MFELDHASRQIGARHESFSETIGFASATIASILFVSASHSDYSLSSSFPSSIHYQHLHKEL
ncbi:hypothetical protein KHA80_17325 [Anaerobacillus sp. HL2]|nr:hypothetical protein KHA80_17325 [Anaerobacillus sp. HL2]